VQGGREGGRGGVNKPATKAMGEITVETRLNLFRSGGGKEGGREGGRAVPLVLTMKAREGGREGGRKGGRDIPLVLSMKELLMA